MNYVIIIKEECHGIIGIARDYASAIHFLITEKWLDEDLWQDSLHQTIEEFNENHGGILELEIQEVYGVD